MAHPALVLSGTATEKAEFCGGRVQRTTRGYIRPTRKRIEGGLGFSSKTSNTTSMAPCFMQNSRDRVLQRLSSAYSKRLYKASKELEGGLGFNSKTRHTTSMAPCFKRNGRGRGQPTARSYIYKASCQLLTSKASKKRMEGCNFIHIYTSK